MKHIDLYNTNPMMYATAHYLLRSYDACAEEKRRVFLTINLLGFSLSQGNICIDLEAYAQQQALIDVGIADTFPALPSWLASIRSWSFVTDHSAADKETYQDKEKAYFSLQGHRLYLNKYWDWENRLVKQLHVRANQSIDHVLPEKLIGGDWQDLAIANSLLSPLSFIVGGPGTGKTTTVAKLLSNMLSLESKDDYKIALAAPTGKAATRMLQALQEKLVSEENDSIKDCLPKKAKTLHSLLGWSQSRRHFIYNRHNRLPLDCLVVDEVSMIDMAMFVAMLEALPDHARVILLGDPYQLASVQAGNVLAEICQPNVLSDFSAIRAEKLGLTGTFDAEKILADNVVLLKTSYRFADDAGIGLLAQACLEGDAHKLKHALKQPEITLFSKSNQEGRQQLIDMAKSHHDQVVACNSVDDAFTLLQRFQLLCAIKKGNDSVAFYNEQLQMRIPWQQTIHDKPIYHGMPIMMQINQPSVGLFNGDMGLIWKENDEEGDFLFLYVKTSEGELKRFLPNQIQGWHCAHAITVHKSQGSEYARVAFALPDIQSSLLTREMLYTAITRAKNAFYCLASRNELEKSICSPVVRQSGLSEKLG